MRIPLFDPGPSIERDRAALAGAFERVLGRGVFVLGAEVEAFELALSAYLGGGSVVGVASGSDALELALRALGVGPGGAVITTPYSFVATAEAIAHAGATPVFSDVHPDTLLLDLEALDRQLERLPQSGHGRPLLPSGEEVAALLPVHLFGAVLDGRALRSLCERYRLSLVEDAAQALGGSASEKAGAQGDAGCFSFFPSKTLGALGDGGAVWARDPAVAARLRSLRQHGQARKGDPCSELGRNSRLDALQAALLAVKLRRLDDDIRERRSLLARYRAALSPLAPAVEPLALGGPGHAAQQIVVRCSRRDELASWLASRGVGTAVYYTTPLHRCPPFARAPRLGSLAHAEAARTLALPLYPGLAPEAVDEVCRLVAMF